MGPASASSWRIRWSGSRKTSALPLRKHMQSFSYILVERLDSSTSFADLQSVLHHIKALGYNGVELNLTPNVAFAMESLADFAESIQLPVVSFLTGANYFREGLCLSSPDA